MAFGKRKTPPPSKSGADVDLSPVVDGVLRSGLPVLIQQNSGHKLTITPDLATVRRTPQYLGFRDDLETSHLTPLAVELCERLHEIYDDARGVSFETIIGALAALTGEFALRAGVEAGGHQMPTGRTYIIGGVADPYLYGGDTDGKGFHILGFLNHMAVNAGADPKRLPDPALIVRRVTEAIAHGLPFPPRPSVPEQHFPLEWSPNACPKHRQLVIHVASLHSALTPTEITAALGLAMGLVLKMAQQKAPMLRQDILVTLAAEIMISVARMAPLQDIVT